jgi:hypothetical protein
MNGLMNGVIELVVVVEVHQLIGWWPRAPITV